MPSQRVRDEAWHNSLSKEHAERISRMLASKLGGDMHTARDLLQETLATAWEKREVVPDPPLPWLLVTAQNHLFNHWRAIKKHDHDEYNPEKLEHAGQSESADAFLDRPDLDLGGALGSLNQTDLEIIHLFFNVGLDCNEIAVLLDIAPAAARKRLSRARHNAKPLLDKFRKDSKEDDNEQPRA